MAQKKKKCCQNKKKNKKNNKNARKKTSYHSVQKYKASLNIILIYKLYLYLGTDWYSVVLIVIVS